MSMSQTLQRRLPGICQFRLSVKNLLRVQMRRRKGACSVWRLCKISILRPVWMIVEVWRSGPLLPSNLCIARLRHKMIIISLQYEVKMLSNLFHPEPNPESVHLKVQMSETWISPRRGRRAATQLFPVSTISDLGSRADPDFHIILSAVVEPKDERDDRRVNRRVNGRQARDSSSRFMCPDYTYKPMMSKDCRFPALPNVPHLATCLAKRFRLSQSAWNARIDIVLSIEDGNQVRWPNATDEFIALNVIAGVPSDVCPATDGPGGLSSGSLVEMINGELRGKTGILKGIKNDRVVVLVIDNGVEVHKFVSASDVRLMPETDLIQLLLQGSRRSTVESGANEQNLCVDFLAEIDHILSGNNDRTEKDEVEILLESRTASPRRCARTSSRSPDDTLRQRTRSPVPKADVPLMTTPIKKKTANHSEANSLPPKRGNFVGKGDISEERWGPIATFGTKYLRAVLFDMNLPTSGSKLELLHRLSKTTAFQELNKRNVPELADVQDLDHFEKRGRGNTLGDCSHEKYGKLAWMTNKELRQVLRQNMLSAEGNKLQLLDRLQAAMNRRTVVKNSAGKPAAAMEENYAKVKEENSDKGLTILSAVADGMTACV